MIIKCIHFIIVLKRIKEKLGKQDFLNDMEEVFERVIENQKQIQTKLLQALRDFTQATT